MGICSYETVVIESDIAIVCHNDLIARMPRFEFAGVI